LGYLQCITDVAGPVPVHIARLGMTERRHAARAQTHVVLRHDECVTDVDDAVPVHVAANNSGPYQTWRGKVDERGAAERQTSQGAR